MTYQVIKRMLDFVFSLMLLVAIAPVFLIVATSILFSSKGGVFHISDRVGKNGVIFKMPKFRTMKLDAPKVATHLLADPDKFMVPFGSFLRKTSLDELPQLWSILIGDMSLVGPRPALFNQYDLIELRTQFGVDKLTPGLTGWAQINGRDSISIREKVQFDIYYLTNISWILDLKIILLTIYYAIRRVNVSH
jgi:O-antigen biosynthesis protein WbqP